MSPRRAPSPVPRPVHFGLRQGGILVHRTPDGPRIGALIDGARVFRGGSVADSGSPVLRDDVEQDRDFLAGCREADGRVVFARSERIRLAPYRACPYLIVLIGTVPRQAGEVRRAECARRWRRNSSRRWTGSHGSRAPQRALLLAHSVN
ncbi:hypothetical protein [Streptomyces sp. MMG1121]|uniref:hypothetical protein n=1 Tax=Streptomyces sp. MMG1121 TaxID=1415544 RepID=UPI0006AE742A|nr:hypothetical protein [Streptomyces sp. MMG1121]